MITHLIFDWGDTLMKDFPDKQGPMAYWDYVELMPEVDKTLELLYLKFELSVATNAGESDSNLVLLALKRAGIAQYFSKIFTSKELGYTKPDIHFFKTIISKLNSSPENCCFVGNDYEKDIVGAKNVGMNTILYDFNMKYEEMKHADFVIVDFNEIIEILKRLEYL